MDAPRQLRDDENCPSEGDSMTLEPYDAAKLDAMAMRFLDLASTFRRMAQDVRQEYVDTIDLHVTRPLQYLDRLDRWASDSEAKLQIELIGWRAERRTENVLDSSRGAPKNARNRSQKK